MQDFTKDPEYIKARREFSRKLRFSKKFRDNLRKSALELETYGLKGLEINEKIPSNLWKGKDTIMFETFLDLSQKFLESIKNCEDDAKKDSIRFKKYQFYKKKNGKSIIIRCTFYKVYEKKSKIACFYFEDGLKKNKRLKGVRYRRSMSTKGYEFIDEGKFRYKHRDIDHFIYIFEGRKTYEIKISARDNKKDKFWIELL